MTTLLYTPGRLVADSRSTNSNRAEVHSDEVQKIRRFGDEDRPLDGEQRLVFGGDTIYLAAACGSSAVSSELIGNLAKFGDQTLLIYNKAKEAFGKNMDAPPCTVVLVGEKELHELEIGSILTGDPYLTHRRHSLDRCKAFGSGSSTALFLHQFFGVPAPLAVAATSLTDNATGGDIVECYQTYMGKGKDRQLHWMERRHRHLDVQDLLDELTDYFSGWNVGEMPFKLPNLPRRRPATKYVKVHPKRTVKAAREAKEAEQAAKAKTEGSSNATG